MARAGRDQQAPMERLVRLIGVLTGHRDGAPVEVLLRAVAPDEAAGDDARRKMLSRDLEHLNALGYDVRNVAEPGADGVYLMRARDNRLAVHLTPEQRGELLRAALAAGLEGMEAHLGDAGASGPATVAASPDLDLVQRAVARRCRLRFTYKGGARTVDPVRVHSGPSGWYLTGREQGSEIDKEFVVTRMSDLELDSPGSAPVAPGEPVRRSLDPLSWEVDPATEVLLEVPMEHRVLAENLLGAPVTAREQGDAVQLTYVVTHRRVFRYRLYELGTRVRLLGPDDVRDEMLAELRTFLVATP
jgi:predicted DNA-binding transcriptional regulator YafY